MLGRLGSGGMGAVYRAEHRHSGQIVALKTVVTPSEVFLPTIRREVHALARLHHPGIVRILGSGTHAGIPWVAMELVEGQTLRHFCAESRARMQTRTRPSALPTAPLEAAEATPALEPQALGPLLELRLVLRLMQRLCATLGFLHGEGLVHRDLKPENILLREEPGTKNGLAGVRHASPSKGRASPAPTLADEASLAPGFARLTPVLVDFGLASRFADQISRETLQSTGSEGTVAYISPEQARGELVDARADLYSLGCILYELLCGQPPFTGARSRDVLRQHLEAPPVPPSRLAPGLPPRLDNLVLGLLAKDPRHRLGYASDVAALLAELDPEAPAEAWGPPAQTYLYRPGFAGREDALLELGPPVEALRAGRGGIVLLAGESGVGKTRLLLEWSRSLQGLRVLGGECSAPDPLDLGRAEGVPLQALLKPLQSIADWCRAWGAAEARRLVGHRVRLLELYEPAFAALPGLEACPPLAELPPEAARLRLYTVLTETFSVLARDGPVLLLLDDLQWADELTLGFLQYLLHSQHLERVPLLVAGAYRPEDIGARQASPLHGLLEHPDAVRLVLDRLEEAAVGSMVCDMLALARAPELFVHFLARHSEGNPFFVAEYLRAAVAQGVLYRDAQGFWQVAEQNDGTATESVYEALPLPTSLRELVTRHLQGLGKSALAVLEAACVLGREGDIGLLRQMQRFRGPRLLEAVTELLRRQLLEEPAPGRLRFLHDKLREVAYGRLQPRRRRALHRAAALALEGQPEEKRDEALAALGHHWDQAGDAERARERYLAAARKARKAHALTESERLFRAYLRLVRQPTAESIAARSELASNVLYLRGRTAEALEEQDKALEEVRALGDRRAEGEVRQKLGFLLLVRGKVEEAHRFLEQALEIHREVGNHSAEGQTLLRLAYLHRQQGHADEARELHARVSDLARASGDRPLEARNLENLAILLHDQGRFGEARELRGQVQAMAREIGDPVLEAVSLGNLAVLFQDEGRMDEAAVLFEQNLKLCRDIGLRRSEALQLGNLAGVRYEQGRILEALDLLEQALDLHRKDGNRLFEGVVLRQMGSLQRVCHGDLGGAGRHLLDASGILSQSKDLIQIGICVCELGHLDLAHGSSARDRLEEARQLAAGLRLEPGSLLARSVAIFERAQQAFEAGSPLFRGQRVEDIPERVGRWLAETGRLPAS